MKDEVIIHTRQISSTKKVYSPLSEQEDKLYNFIEKLGEGIGIIDLTYDFVLCNKAMSEIFETTDLEGRNLSQFLSSNKEMEKLMDVAGKLNEGERFTMEICLKTDKQRYKHVSITLTPQLDSDGKLEESLFCVFKDISPTKELIEELQAARDDAQKAYQTIEAKNEELQEINEKLYLSEMRLSELNAILLEYIKATHK